MVAQGVLSVIHTEKRDMMLGPQGNWAGGDWVTSRRSEELSGAVLGVDWRAEAGCTGGPGPP